MHAKSPTFRAAKLKGFTVFVFNVEKEADIGEEEDKFGAVQRGAESVSDNDVTHWNILEQ